jgi:2-oxoglutarate ferredoxin oxidoreductase subunit alpha
MASFPSLGFSLAFKYRNPAVILSDAFLGQVKEDLTFPDVPSQHFDTSWATTGARGPVRHVLSSMHLAIPDHNVHSEHLRSKYDEIGRKEQRSEKYQADDATVLLVAYGICARLSMRAVRILREKGIRAGLLRPITLYPFPSGEIEALVGRSVKRLVVVELNMGQMLEDVRLATAGRARVDSLQRLGGVLPSPQEIVRKVEEMSP